MMIERLLVANRGEIASRIFRTCRRLGIATVAVFSEPDADAPFVRDSDTAVSLGGRTATESYLRQDAIVAAAIETSADAVHPGYGFLAENAEFAAAVVAAGLTWVGPSPEAIAAMGSKTEARELMKAAGVPVLPGGCVDSADDLEELGRAVGYPLLVKASAGGGGKGMRLVQDPAELAAAVESARREAASAFGDETLLLERFATGSRHVEIQIVGDDHDAVAALHERDCSVQRRHQKVIEEAPSPAVDAELRARMGAAAVAAAKAIGYRGVGTVEFLLDSDGEFFFLEVNTRLQVEHPVTELVTGLDLVELQLTVAEGGALPRAALEPALDGHAIEARLYAEDAANDFLPATGTLRRFAVASEGIRLDAGVEAGSAISPYYDPLIAKVIAHGATRGEAARRLADALARADLSGTTTNRDFLVRVLRHPEFLDGTADTGFLERHSAAELGAPLADADDERLAAAAAALAGQARRRREATALGSLPSGWRNNQSTAQTAVFAGHHHDELRVDYHFDRDGRLAQLTVDESPLGVVRLRLCTPELVDLEVDGLRCRYRVSDETVATAEWQCELRERDRLGERAASAPEGSLAAPMPATVIRILAAAGTQVTSGQPLVVLEAMKMEHEIVAPFDGTVDLRVAEGEQVNAGAILAVIEAFEPIQEETSG